MYLISKLLWPPKVILFEYSACVFTGDSKIQL